MKRSLELIGRRIRQTPQTFSNAPAVFGQLMVANTTFGPKDITFKLRNGYTIVTPNATGARFPVYEIFADDAYDLDSLLKDLPEKPVVLDVGGQIGAFSLAVCDRQPAARIHTYEASPFTARYLQANVSRNNLDDRVTVHATAMSGHEGEFTFTDTQTASGHNGLTIPENLGGVEVTVPATTFDNAVAEAGGSVHLVKMDIEGAEYDVLFNSSPSSWESVQRVVMEYHPMPGRSLRDLEDFFGKLGLVRVRHESIVEGLGSIWLARS